MSDGRRPRLDDWIRRLGGSGLPIFSRTVQEVSGIAERRGSSARDLADAIGRDASLAARLLRVANSPIFNPQGRRIETISSAVVLVGFDAVRELAVSLALIEQVLQGRRHFKVTREMSRAFHAAAQARAFAEHRRDPTPEEVFVAALLLRIGEMAFWSVADREGTGIERLMASGSSEADAEQQVLGFTLAELSRRLVADWRLGELVERASSGGDDVRAADVRMGHRVALAVETSGWRAARVSRTIDEVAAHLGVPRATAIERVHENAQEAARIAALYGVPTIETYLLQAELPGRPARGDAELQLRVLKQIAEHLDGAVNPDELTRLVLRGVRRGVGMENAFVALRSPSGRSLQIRHVVGGSKAGVVPLPAASGDDLFARTLASGKPLLVTDANLGEVRALLTDEIRRHVALPFVILPIRAGERSIGLLYADRAGSGAAIDDETLAALRVFTQQLALGLASRSG
ncbi:MAG TPA: HDOD domain-containing protein [Pseudomonadales bacterium]